MATVDYVMCMQPALTNRERVRYFPRQLLTADDMRTEQEYLSEKLRRHNRFLHGWGVACGLEVVKPGEKDPKWQVTICPGYALTPQGDEILVSDKIKFDLQTKLQSPEPCAVRWSCPPEEAPPADADKKIIYLAIRYIECNSRPVRVHPAGCSCDEAACEYSRVRDSFELRVLLNLPNSHKQLKDFYDEWCGTWNAWKAGRSRRKTVFPLPTPPCPPCVDDPWVVLATITLPDKDQPRIIDGMIKYDDRLPLYSSIGLQILHTCK